jgi:DNA invertase Pin-like site-specific DNA recombinase
MAGKRKLFPALGYIRTSSATNVGPDKDSDKRQIRAIEAWAKSAGAEIVEWFRDAAVSGADPIETRPGFAAALAKIAGNGVRTIAVETAQRFARDLMVQEVGFTMLRELGITLVAADSPAAFLDDGPTSTLIRQILGAVAQFDKAMTVAKLKGARERIRRQGRKCEGRKSYAEEKPETVALAKQLNADGLSLRRISVALAAQGHVTGGGKPYVVSAVATMLGPDRANQRPRLARYVASAAAR